MGLSDTSPTTVAPAPSNYDLCKTYSGVAGALTTINCAANIVGRYLIIQIPGVAEVLTLCEVEVFGEEGGK